MTYLVLFLSDNEFKVASRIEKTREDYFLPTYRDKEGRERPLYPGYIFYRYHHRWPQVLEIQGVARVLGRYDGEQFWPHRVPDLVIEKLEARMREGGGTIRLKDQKQETDLANGDIVIIKIGPATGWFGQVDNRKPKRGQIGLRLFETIDKIEPGPLSYLPLHFVKHYMAAPEGLSAAETKRRRSA